MFNIASEETYQDGQIIIKEGTTGDWVYVVMSGTVEISKTVGGKKFVIESLQPNEIFGELGFLGGVTRTATARAVGETTVGVIDRAFLDREFNKLPSDFRTILTTVVQRFKKMIERTSELSSRKEIRVLKTLSLKYKDKNSFVNAYTGNLSSGGLFIKTKNPLEQGEQFLLKLQLPGLSDPMKIKCEVAWSRKEEEKTDDSPAGMGVAFIEMTNNDNQMLKEYLKDTPA
jgi:CRP/FNR family cyclic AMP-dependent transcriptional regulator